MYENIGLTSKQDLRALALNPTLNLTDERQAAQARRISERQLSRKFSEFVKLNPKYRAYRLSKFLPATVARQFLMFYNAA